MYEILLKWGLETLQGALSEKSKEEIAITLEAIKTKNAFVIQRYNHAFITCQELLDLYISIENMLRIQAAKKVKNNDKYIDILIHDIHPERYRSFRKIRGMFQLTNDLLSSYSMVAFELINAESIRNIMEEKNYRSKSAINNIYLSLWSYLGVLFSGLVRISSSDLRFWLSDTSYSDNSKDFAILEFDLFRKNLLKKRRSGYSLLLDNSCNIECFWENGISNVINTYK